MASPRLGKVALERGLANERRVLDACRLGERPEWMLRARQATRLEDRSGIDIVVQTDVGSLSIQVKSSLGGKAHFRRRPLLNVGLVVVGDGDSPQALLNKVVSELGPIRADHLRELEKRGVKRPAPPKPPPARAKGKPAKRPPTPTPPPIQTPPPTQARPSVASPSSQSGAPSWTELRDCLLAALLGRTGRAMGDDELRIATEALAKRSVRLADIVARYPTLFRRTAGGILATPINLVQAYRLRLARYWEPPRRDSARKVLGVLSSIVEGKEHVVLTELPQLIAAELRDQLGEEEIRHVVRTVSKANGWEVVPREGDSKRHVRPKPWLRDPAQAEAHLGEAAMAVMGPFLPVDPVAMAAALSL
jgi:hypothetical protein